MFQIASRLNNLLNFCSFKYMNITLFDEFTCRFYLNLSVKNHLKKQLDRFTRLDGNFFRILSLGKLLNIVRNQLVRQFTLRKITEFIIKNVNIISVSRYGCRVIFTFFELIGKSINKVYHNNRSLGSKNCKVKEISTCC